MGIVGRGNAADGDDLVEFTTRSGGRLDVVLRDVGWKANAPSVSVWVPEGVDMSFLGRRGFHIDEIGLAIHHARYRLPAAQCQLPVGGRARLPAGRNRSCTRPAAGSGSAGCESASRIPTTSTLPPWRSTASCWRSRPADGSNVEGGGWLRDEVVGGSRLREIGFGLRIIAPIGETEFILSGRW